MKRALLERGILLPLLAIYAAAIALAAWRHEIRPTVFDPPVALARSALRLVGIRPGVAVFTADRGRAQDEKIAALCVEVRATDAAGRTRQVYPPRGARCPAPAPRLWVTGETIALQRSLVALRSALAARRAGIADASGDRFPVLLAESIAEHFRGRALAEGPAPDRYALLWTESRVSYDSGALGERIVALLRWTDAEPGVFISWRPAETILAEHWPAPDES